MVTALYICGSTEAQTKMQQNLLFHYVKANNIEPFRAYIDDGFPVSDMSRTQLKNLLNDIEKGEIEKVIVASLNRFSRSEEIMENIVKIFDKNNVSIVALK